ncbi:MAG: DUF4234 domain-containing protein [Chloroflexi bacterium]|nr:DUF4234 domain-containing protein [Chloroflexota bacterium]
MIKRRELPMQVLLFIITLGIYGIYWLYVTNKEIIEHLDGDESPGLWTFLTFVPIVQWFAYWKHGRRLDEISDGRYAQLTVFLAWIVFAPIVWFLTQTELNKLADAQDRVGQNMTAKAAGSPGATA